MRLFTHQAVNKQNIITSEEQELFFFPELSPDSCFFQPRGAHIYKEIVAFIKSAYSKRGFKECISPNVHNSKLCDKSALLQQYVDKIFSCEEEKQTLALKTMGCLGHCLIFAQRPRSSRELPLRMVDFRVLPGNDLDDAHIFCTPEQISSEIKGCLEILQHVYRVFGFTFQLKLSTRPDNFFGEVGMWNDAEKKLTKSLDAFGEPWTLNPGEGSFYGPKIDITITDALKRPHHCATIQLDFLLPSRFNLQYDSVSGEKESPVIIHQAILGSVEKFIVNLTESYGGNWPFWLSPFQCIIVPEEPKYEDYAQKVASKISDAGFICDMDVGRVYQDVYEIENIHDSQYHYIFVVDEEEENNLLLMVNRDGTFEEADIEDVINDFRNLKGY